ESLSSQGRACPAPLPAGNEECQKIQHEDAADRIAAQTFPWGLSLGGKTHLRKAGLFRALPPKERGIPGVFERQGFMPRRRSSVFADQRPPPILCAPALLLRN